MTMFTFLIILAIASLVWFLRRPIVGVALIVGAVIVYVVLMAIQLLIDLYERLRFRFAR